MPAMTGLETRTILDTGEAAPPKKAFAELAKPNLSALTGLRFFAAISVVIYHFARPALNNWHAPLVNIAATGYTAVSLFFLLSGFILAYSYLDQAGGMRGSRRSFYASRFARIYPAYFLAFLLAAPTDIYTSLHANHFAIGTVKLLASALVVLTLQQAWTPWTAWSWNFPAWSVSVEAFFYLTFPWIGPRLGRLRKSTCIIACCGLWLAALSAPVLFVFFTHKTTAPGVGDHLQMAIEFNPLLRLPEFAIGILLGRLFNLGLAVPLGGRLLSYVSAGSILLVFAFCPFIPHPLLANGLMVPLFALLILSLAQGEGWLHYLLSRPGIVMLGEASYGIYILQIPVSYVLRLPPPHNSLRTFGVYLLALVATAIVSWRFVESPFRSRLRQWLTQGKNPNPNSTGEPSRTEIAFLVSAREVEAKGALPAADTAEETALDQTNVTLEEFIPAHVKKDLLSGTSALGIGVIAERGCSFLANILAARLGGASTFGVYALAISTASNVSAYAAGGIGSTAIRFSGEHPRGSSSYTALTKALAIISSVSALLATVVLWLGAAPISTLLKKPSVAGPLHWAALSAAGIIMLECCRGFLVGQRRIKALLLLSGLVGAGYLSFLPAMARLGPTAMICSQSAVTLGAVLICVACYRPLGLTSPVSIETPAAVGPLLKRVWSFGVVQLASLVWMNAAGWWLTSLIARSDTTMVQMGFFAVAHQLRNIVALGPSLLTEGSLAVMAGSDRALKKTPDNVMAISTYACTFASLVMAGVGTIILPWGLVLLYGNKYAGAITATALALATAVVHMGSAPMSARLSIVSIKTTGIVNTLWAAFVVILATVVLLPGGNAAKGAAVYLAGHLFVSVLQILSLRKHNCVPNGTIASYSSGVTGALAIAALACLREVRPQSQIWTSLLMCAVLCGATLAMLIIGKHRGWLPSQESIERLLSRGISAIRPRTSPRSSMYTVNS